jgi:pimeloyl-ACP methyl ester carboxylesterase
MDQRVSNLLGSLAVAALALVAAASATPSYAQDTARTALPAESRGSVEARSAAEVRGSVVARRLIDDATLRARYATAPSRFVTVDGVSIHLRDEGSGPVLLLLNGHLGSLHMWDDWVPELARHFRVIRIDYPPYGLSGPDPTNDYSTRRAIDLVLKLADILGIERFHIGGTSNGAMVALFFAVEHPSRVDKLVLSTLPAGRPPPRQSSAAMLQAVKAVREQAPYQPREFWQAFLEDIVVNDAVITPALVDRYHDLNNRTGAKAWVDAYIQTQYRVWDSLDVPAYYARLTRPTLLQWGVDGVVLPGAVGRQVAALLVNAPLTYREYSNAGHLPMIEQPVATVRDAIRFLQTP